MQLTLYTDYSLRVLIYLALYPRETPTISEIAERYGISRNHLVKVVHRLAREGFVRTIRGRGGGIVLARSPEEITIGEVVRCTEGPLRLLDCLGQDGGDDCPITAACRLKRVLGRAQDAFLRVLDETNLAEVVHNRSWLRHRLAAGGGG